MDVLGEIEKETYEFIRDAGEIQTRNLPNKRMTGALARLESMGLIEIYKRYTSIYRRKKKKFARIK